MKSFKNTLMVMAALSLGACSITNNYSDVEALNDVDAVGSAFTQALTSEYRTMTNSEMKQMFDYPDSLHFARKGLAAAAGNAVMPEPITDWNLSNQDIGTLQNARNRLVVVYDLGVREIAPELSALAQSRFDCWIEEQEERWGDTTIPCKTDFMAALIQLEGLAPAPAPVVAAPAPAPEPVVIDTSEPMAPEDAVYLVFFNFDSSKITSGASSVLDAVAAEAAKFPPNGIAVTGHADTSGAQSYNSRLSIKRANKVREALIQRGVDPSIVFTDAKGETDLMVLTNDGTREPANRRATITFQ